MAGTRLMAEQKAMEYLVAFVFMSAFALGTGWVASRKGRNAVRGAWSACSWASSACCSPR
jgi:hypothetical protein